MARTNEGRRHSAEAGALFVAPGTPLLMLLRSEISRYAVYAVRAACMVFLAGCEPPRPQTSPGSAVDTLEVLVTIGEVHGPVEYQFGHVGGVAADEAGRIYVSDRMGSFVRVFSPRGEFLRQIGREGDGPGEFRHPTDLFFDDAGQLWVRDAQRATVFAASAPGAIPDSAVATRRFEGLTNWVSSARSRLIDSLYYYPGYVMPRGGPHRYFYFAYDETGMTGDTVAVPAYATLGTVAPAFYRISEGGGRIVEGLNRVPFEPGPAWELTSRGTIIGGDGRGPLVETNRAGDTLRVIPVRPGRGITAGERADSARSLRSRVDSLPVRIDQVENLSPWVRRQELPDSVPAYTGVHTAVSGEIWVVRWPLEGHSAYTHYHIHAPDGAFLSGVLIPGTLVADIPPFVSHDTFVGVVRDELTEVHRVVVVRLDTR